MQFNRMIRVGQRSFHMTHRNEILPIVAGIGILATSAVGYFAAEHMYVKYKNQTVSDSDQLEFGPHPLFSSKRDNIGIDIGSGYGKVANLTPRIGNASQPHMPKLIKFKLDQFSPPTTAFKLEHDSHYHTSSYAKDSHLYSIETLKSIQALTKETLGKDAGKDRLSLSSIVFSLPTHLSQSKQDELISAYYQQFGTSEHHHMATANIPKLTGASKGKETSTSSSSYPPTLMLGYVRDEEAALLALLEGGYLDHVDHDKSRHQFLLLVDIGASFTQSTLYEGINSSENFMGNNREKWIKPSNHPKIGYYHVNRGMQQVTDALADQLPLESNDMHLRRMIAGQVMEQLDNQSESVTVKQNNAKHVLAINHAVCSSATNKAIDSLHAPISEAVSTLSTSMKANEKNSNKVSLKVVYYGGGAHSTRIKHQIAYLIETQLNSLLCSEEGAESDCGSLIGIEEIVVKEPESLVAKGTSLAAKYGWTQTFDPLDTQSNTHN